MIDTLITNPEFEHQPNREVEKKYLPVFPELLTQFRENAYPIEQYYLSHPSEQFSLRFREATDDNASYYTATLKDRGKITGIGLDRLEVEIEISSDLYNYYRSDDVPILKKFRTPVNRHVSIDFFEDSHVHIESEDPIAWVQATERLGSGFIDITGDHLTDNEWRAHFTYRQQHDGREALVPIVELDPLVIAREIAAEQAAHPNVVVQILGRSGSGKSSIVEKIKEELSMYGLYSIVLSSDNYHRGAAWLKQHNNGDEWTQWDHPIVYDTQTLASDIESLKNGVPVQKRIFDFNTAEPVVDSLYSPSAQVIIVEGLYAGANGISDISDLSYTVPTPFATCVGRRLLRDARERSQFADLTNSLRYILEKAEPAWKNQRTS